MFKAGLKKFQSPSSLFYLIALSFTKKLQICKQTSKIVYSHQRMYAAIYLKMIERAECSSRLCKMLHRRLQLNIVIRISIQPSEKYIQQAQTICLTIFSLFLKCVLVVVLSSSSMKMIYIHGLINVRFYIATCQKKNIIKESVIFVPQIPMSSSKSFQTIE